MSRLVTTKLGRFRAVTDGKRNWWLWECPVCKRWGGLSEPQMDGKVSVHHAADNPACTYHETHEFAKELVITVQVRRLMRADGDDIDIFEEETLPPTDIAADWSA